MQVNYLSQSNESQNMMYSGDMSKPLKRQRPKMGEHLAELRKKASLSQYELARLLSEPQSNISFWELADKPPRSDVLPKLAKILGVRVDTILNGPGNKESSGGSGGPVGKVRQVFEQVSKLPKKQQEKVVEFVSAFVNQYQK